MTSKLEITNEDCNDLMARYKDNYFELAIVDPPYGIGASSDSRVGGSYTVNMGGVKKKVAAKQYTKKEWDNNKPNKEYFNELQRVSKNQIIWGGNYFIEDLTNTSCFIVWNKMNGENNNADCELAWTSFKTAVRMLNFKWNGMLQQDMGIYKEIRVHPTQKPVKLYEWLLKKYANEGDKILDTHLGSGSSAIACYNMGFDLVACELDKEYYDMAMERIIAVQNQLTLI